MATFITIKLEENLTQEQRDALRYLFSDALGEFRGARLPAEEYLEERYPADKVLCDPEKRKQKLAYIRMRNELADLLHNPVLALENTVVDSSDEKVLVRRYVKAALNKELDGVIDTAIMGMQEALAEENLDKEKVQQFLASVKETGGELKTIVENACLELFTKEELEFMTAFFESPSGKAITSRSAELGQVCDASIDLWHESLTKMAEEVFPTKKEGPPA